MKHKHDFLLWSSIDLQATDDRRQTALDAARRLWRHTIRKISKSHSLARWALTSIQGNIAKHIIMMYRTANQSHSLLMVLVKSNSSVQTVGTSFIASASTTYVRVLSVPLESGYTMEQG
jgi:hypothetical protein